MSEIRIVHVNSRNKCQESDLKILKCLDLIDKSVEVSELENDFIKWCKTYIILTTKSENNFTYWLACAIIADDKNNTFHVLSAKNSERSKDKLTAIKCVKNMIQNEDFSISLFDAIKSIGLLSTHQIQYDIKSKIVSKYKILQIFDMMNNFCNDDLQLTANQLNELYEIVTNEVDLSKISIQQLSKIIIKFLRSINYIKDSVFLDEILLRYQAQESSLSTIRMEIQNSVRNLKENSFSTDALTLIMNNIVRIINKIKYNDALMAFLCFNLIEIAKTLLKNIKICGSKLILELFRNVLNIAKIKDKYYNNFNSRSYKSENAIYISIALIYHSIYQIQLNELILDLSSEQLVKQLLASVLVVMSQDLDHSNIQCFIRTVNRASNKELNRILLILIERSRYSIKDLDELSNLIVIFKDNPIYIQKLCSNPMEDFPTYYDLQQNWIIKKFDEQFPNNGLTNFKIFMDYPPVLLDTLFEIVTDKHIKDLEKTFYILNKESALLLSEKCKILESISKIDSSTWISNVGQIIIDELMKKHLMDFKGHKLTQLRNFFHDIFNKGWSLNTLRIIILKIKREKNLEDYLRAIRFIYDFGIHENHIDSKDIAIKEIIESDTKHSSVMKSLQYVVLNHIFPKSHEKDVSELIKEISSKNLISQTFLKAEFDKVYEKYLNISSWNEQKIKRWREEINKVECSMYEKIAVVLTAFKIHKNFDPRTIQILSLILLLNPSYDKGRLAQINTGEGKTAIIAMFAVIKALEGHKIDVITSSPELAKPQVQEYKAFYKMFDLTSAHNDWEYLNDAKDIYKCDIVYGVSSDFQGDILRHEFSKKDILEGRKSDVAIVDEVDNMLIDGKDSFVYLSNSLPGMNYLEPFYAAIWHSLNTISQSISEIDGQYYLMSGDPEPCCIPIQTNLRHYITSKIYEQYKEELEKKEEATLKVPNHLRELVEKYLLEEWIDNAFLAKFYYKNKNNYILHNDKITIVDSENTGVLQMNTTYSDGLHQFIQLKHGTKLSPENLTTNFMSNVALFRRYGSNLFGLTGTLGDEHTKGFLERIYNVDCIIVPPFKLKRYKELPTKVLADESDWYDEIVDANMTQLLNNRAVLIITKTIEEADELRKRFSKEFDLHKIKRSKIRSYTKDTEAAAIKHEMESADLMIATYIAGRGTDIKTAKSVEDNGGLHVCITSLSSNTRVELQNTGRTSRTGNLGTSQFIINSDKDIEKLKEQRDLSSKKRIQEGEESIKATITKENVFGKFCDFLEEFRNDEYERKAVEERFGIYLKINKNCLEHKFEGFKREIQSDKSLRRVIRNPIYHVQKGNDFYAKKSFDAAIDEYSKAINLDEEFSEIAYYNRGFAIITKYREKSSTRYENIHRGIKDLIKAREKVEQREMELEAIMLARGGDKNFLSEQMHHKMTVYVMLKHAIEQAIGPNSQKHNEKVAQFENREIELVKKENRLKQLRFQLNLLPDYLVELEKLEEKLEFLEKANENTKDISLQIKNICDSLGYQNYRKIKDELEDLKNTTEDLNNHKKAYKDYLDGYNNKGQGTIRQALSNDLDMKIEIKSIEDSLPQDQDKKLYENEIKEFKTNGTIGMFYIHEIPPINWGVALGVLLLGIAQAIGGAALCIASFGSASSFGISLMMEGLSDVTAAIKRGFIDKTLTWTQYAIEKVISIATNIILMGFKALKKCLDIGKDVYKTTASGVRCIFKTAASTTKEGFSLFAKKLGLEIGKKIGTEVATHLVNIGVEKMLVPEIEKHIVELVTPKIQSFLQSNLIVQEWLNIDAENRDSVYYEMILKIAMKCLSSEETQSALKQIASGIADGVLSRSKYTKHIYNELKKVKQISDIVLEADKFLIKFGKSVSDEYNQIKKSQKKESKAESSSNENVTVKNQATSSKASKNDDFFETKSNKPSGVNFSNNLEEEQAKPQKAENNSGDVCKNVASSVSKRIASMVNNTIFVPVTSDLINKGVNGLTSGWDEAINKQIEANKNERIIKINQNKDPYNQLNSKEFKSGTQNKENIEGAQEDINNIKEGGKIGAQHLGSVVDAYEDHNIYIEVIDENYKFVKNVGKRDGKKKVTIRLKGNGHVTLPDGSDPLIRGHGENDCVLNVISSQLSETDPQKITDRRQKLVRKLNDNIIIQVNQQKFVDSLRTHNEHRLHESGISHIDDDNELLKQYNNYLGENKRFMQGPHRFGDLKDKIIERFENFIEANHFPPKGCYEKGINANDKYAFIMYKPDHRAMASSRGGKYVQLLENMINREPKTGFGKTLLLEGLNICQVSIVTKNSYKEDIIRSINLFKKDKKINSEDAKLYTKIIENFPEDSSRVSEYITSVGNNIFGKNCEAFNYYKDKYVQQNEE